MKYITKKGLEKLKAELEERKNKKRREIAAVIKEAKEHGDLSENAEYTEARRIQRENESRIMELENIIRTSIIAQDDAANISGVIKVGSKVSVKVGGKEMDLAIVGSSEADPLGGKISNESPIGRALLGKKVGNTVEVELPNGKLNSYLILSVN